MRQHGLHRPQEDLEQVCLRSDPLQSDFLYAGHLNPLLTLAATRCA